MLEQAEALGLARRYAQEVRKRFNPAAILLFGSYAKGNPTGGQRY